MIARLQVRSKYLIFQGNDCLDVPRKFIDEGEDVHHVEKERRQC
jgi:hypothetical protein